MLAWKVLFFSIAALLAAAALPLLYFALLHDRPRGRRRCPRCWYDMSATAGNQCPECGRTTTRHRRFSRTRRHYRPALLALLLALAAYLTARIPEAIRHQSWWAVLPTPAMVAILQVYDTGADQHFDRLVGAGVIPADMNKTDRILAAMVCQKILLRPVPPGPYINIALLPFYRQSPSAVPAGAMARADDLERKLQAIEVVSTLRSDAWPALRGLAACSREPQLRYQVLAAVARLGASGEHMLLDLLRDRNAPIRSAALTAIIQADVPQSRAVVAAIMRDLDNTVTRSRAIAALEASGPNAALALPDLHRLLNDPDILGVRYGCITAAARLDHGTGRAVPLLTAALADPHDVIRLAAVRALQGLGPAAVAALPDLERTAEADPSKAIRAAAERAIASIRRKR